MTSARNDSIGIVLAAVPGYSETFFVSKINGLAAKGFEVTVLARGVHRGGLPAKVVNPWPVPASSVLRMILVGLVVPLTWLRAPIATMRFWRLEKAEGSGALDRLRLIYINAHILVRRFHWLSFGFATQALGRECVAHAIGAQMAVSIRGYDISVYPLNHPGCYSKVWKHVDKVHSLSDYLLNKAISLGLHSSVKSVIISPAINWDEFQVAKVRDSIRTMSILTVARLHWIKGLEYALMAIRIMIDQGYLLHYTIIGDGSEKEKLVFEIDSLRLSPYVSLAGRKDPKEVKAMMQSADLYLQPSLDEGFCNAVIEAQAAGLPCIVSAAGGLPENVENEVTGWLVPPRDSRAIANVIKKVAQMSPEERLNISIESQKRVRSQFGMADHVAAWEKFYGRKGDSN